MITDRSRLVDFSSGVLDRLRDGIEMPEIAEWYYKKGALIIDLLCFSYHIVREPSGYVLYCFKSDQKIIYSDKTRLAKNSSLERIKAIAFKNYRG